jgi:hypothetical protein
MTDTLFDIEPTKEEGFPDVKYSDSFLPQQCPKCNATWTDPRHAEECLLCDGKPVSMLWHDYVRTLKNYIPHSHQRMAKFADEIETEWKKLGRYIRTMEGNADFNATDAVNTANENLEVQVCDFEEELWDV